LKNQDVLGADVGGVIIDGGKNDNTDTSFFSDRYLQTTAVPRAFEALNFLVASRFGNRVFIVSKCGERVEMKTRSWFDHHHFYEMTGIARSNLRFCRERHEKAPICKDLGITHFIDDKLEVLSYLVDLVPNLYLFRPKPREVDRFSRFLPRVTQIQSWPELLAKLPPPQS
jgi:hypothetical protein